MASLTQNASKNRDNGISVSGLSFEIWGQRKKEKSECLIGEARLRSACFEGEFEGLYNLLLPLKLQYQQKVDVVVKF